MSKHSASLLVSVANGLSVARIFSVPIIVFLIWRTPQADASRYAACWLIVLLHAGDMLDGYLARLGTQKLASPNHFGEMIDPIADKLYLGAAYITLAVTAQFPNWFGALVVVRDVAIILGWTILYKRYGLRLHPNFLGKATDAGLVILLVAILLRVEPTVLGLMTQASAILVVWSGWAYGRLAIRSVSAMTIRRHRPVATPSGRARLPGSGIGSAS